MNSKDNEGFGNKTSDRFIAFFDILGFKDFVNTNEHAVVLKTMNELTEEVTIPIGTMANNILNSPGWGLYAGMYPVKPILFSDTILLLTQEKCLMALKQLIFHSLWLLHRCNKLQIPIKGAISCGEMTVDLTKSIYLGKPIIEAYELQNQLLYYGCVLDLKVEKFIEKVMCGVGLPDLINYKTPQKDGSEFHLNVNWPSWWVTSSDGDQTTLDRIKMLSGKATQEKHRKYIDNTLDFANFCFKAQKKIE